MPELPEVQTIVDDLNKKVAGRKIVGAWFDWPKMIKPPSSPKTFERILRGGRILKVERRAKYIKIYLSGDRLLLIHQKLTGHLLVGKWKIEPVKKVQSLLKGPLEERVNDYIHLILYLDDGRMLAFSDLRKFGTERAGKTQDIENLPELKNLGPDALDSKLNFNRFADLISSEERKIKQVLMDQEVIAGIGNIYSDEILWEAKIHPFKPANKLTQKELKALWLATRKILEKALKLRGTSISDYRDTSGEKGYYTEARKVYQREGEKCPRKCGGTIKRVKIGGRSAHYCPKCQRL
ncbi:MAG: DNA-formamidopyrimidine glycosylase [Candidatus Harrisonbacteria bacterium RIFCSPLOWO2_01_FULL_44_18]|uniref:DNA-formamidopyrimidine glycosylase n=1 Tax=Candidatus Harrisonbacteria bacterium RIFCSPLOWO2_01_FULL_44_18 TaxID=1798407 RepID=A0A1G1ZPN8_9BACT|nr:MAG: DNA-formamidopyrimidine glycosylase [Candidatus Harrisonbacteria bacterium RIFCSPLOWO2_01_FULL_44_18]